MDSVTRWLNYFKKFGHLQLRKLAQKHHIFAKVGLKFYPNAKLTLKNLPTTLNIFAKSGQTVYGAL